MYKYLITGGAGFIGSNIARELVEKGEMVKVLDNYSTGKRENIFPIKDKIEIFEGDVRSLNIVERAMKEVDYVLHQAALPSVARSIDDPTTSNEVNIAGTLNVLIAARNAKVKRVIFASSSSIYGANPELPKVETMMPMPISPYAISKFTGEMYCKTFFSLYGLETVCLRYFNVFGPNQDPSSQYAAVIPKFIDMIRKGRSPEIYGDGEQARDFTYVKNVVKANLLACEKKGIAGEVFNVACQKMTSINILVTLINKILKTEIKPIYMEARIGEVKQSLANISKAIRIINYSPEYDLEQGLIETIKSQNIFKY